MGNDMFDKYYDKQGKPISREEWADLHNSKYKIIKQTPIPPKGMVSTVWLGSNHNFGEGKPLIFETMYFPRWDDNDLVEDICKRYETLEQAKEGHEEIVKDVS